MNEKARNKAKVAVFLIIFCMLFALANWLVSPVWEEWGNYDSLHGFYEQPEDTIETVFLGTSLMVNGVIPMELYDKYGICAYNLGTQQQPMIISYYWLREAYRLHDSTLKNVVIDLSALDDEPKEAYFLKAIFSMRLSDVKMSALIDYFGSYTDAIRELVPIFRYHSRWKELGNTDFAKANIDVKDYLRGYNFDLSKNIERSGFDYSTLKIPEYVLDEDAGKTEFNATSLSYFEKIMDFSKEKNLNVILIKFPPYWSSKDHNAAQELADKYGLDYIDYNFVPYINELEYNGALDGTDRKHFNYYGAAKFSACIGKYLVDNSYSEDIKGNKRYEFMDDQLDQYQNIVVKRVELMNEPDPAEYIEKASQLENCIVFISAYIDAAKSLTDEGRERFKELGLKNLSKLGYRGSYIGVIENESIIYDQKKDAPTELEKGDSEYALLYEGACNGVKYAIQSGGKYSDVKSSIIIGGKEYSNSQIGLNIVVYDFEQHELLDLAEFNTCSSFLRVTDLQAELDKKLQKDTYIFDENSDLYKLFLYNRRCYNTKMIYGTDNSTEDGFRNLVDAFSDKRDYAVIFTVVGDAEESVDAIGRDYFESIGLTKLSALEAGNSYIGVLYNHRVICNKKGEGNAPISYNAIGYNIRSVSAGSEKKASIKIDNIERLEKPQDGINVVIYDVALEKIVTVISK